MIFERYSENKKTLVSIFIVILAVSLLYLWQSKQEKIVWIKYENERLGFGLEYPDGFVVHEGGETEPTFVEIVPKDPNTDKSYQAIKIMISPTIHNTAQEFAAEKYEKIDPRDFRKTEVSALPAVRRVFDKKYYHNRNDFILVYKHFSYELSIDLPSAESDHVIKSFKIIEKPDNIAISDKIYRYENQYIGMSLDYPSDLYADGRNDAFQVTFLAPDNLKRHSSASMGALAFYLKEGQTIEEYAERLKPNTLFIKDSTVAGRKAKEITSTPDGYSGSIWIYTLVETKRGVLMISFLRDTSRAQTYRSIIDSIQFKE